MTVSVRISLFASILLVGFLSSAPADAQAFCALRDPVSSIYGFFPKADSYRSIVKVVGNTARDTISETLPLKLHFNELGRHTIYVATEHGKPIGIVHARSEGDRWGLTEVVWAFDVDLNIVDFSFQRCRNPGRKDLERSDFREQLRGMSFSEVRDLLTDDAKRFQELPVALPGNSRDLALIVTHSALKTMVVTETVWRTALHSIRLQNLMTRHFKNPVKMLPIPAPYTTGVTKEIANQQIADGTGIVRDKLIMQRISNDDGGTLGFLFDTVWKTGATESNLQWLLDEDGTVMDVVTNGVDSGNRMRESLSKIVGFEPSNAAHCANALELSAFELSLLTRVHSGN